MGKFKQILLLLTISLTLQTVYSANILFYFGVATYSHRIVVWPLVEHLASQGHKVTFFSPNFPKKDHENVNVTEVSPKVLQESMASMVGADSNIIQKRIDGFISKLWYDIEIVGTVVCERLMEDPEYVNWVKTSKFDLTIVDGLHNECGLAIPHLHKIPFMIFATTTVFMWHYDAYGFPAETSWISDLSIALPHDMSLVQRVVNTLSPLFWYYTKVFFVYPRMEAAINKGLNLQEGHKIDMQAMETNTTLVLLNTHFSTENSRSLPSLIVPVGGMHLTNKRQGIPKDMQKFIDESPNGFIFVSFGTGAQISKTPLEMQREFFYALGNSTNVRFLWKWEGETVPDDMPKNVFTAKWMPQVDILASPKIKAFMTHGGMLSIMEAVFSAVPLIIFPIFAEQDYNAARVEGHGYGIRLEIVGIKQAQIQNAVHSILTDPKYKLNMEHVSKIFKDRQNSPRDTAVWWVEYILRHKSTPFLIPLGRHQTWYTRRLLDVWGVIFGPFLILFGIALGFGLKTILSKRSSRSIGEPGKSGKVKKQ